MQRWLDGLRLGTQSVKNFRTVLHTLFQFAEACGYVIKGGNPVAGTESMKVKSGEIQIFSPVELTALLKSASSDFLPLLALGAFAGLRTAEVERIEWRDIDLAGGFITVPATEQKRKYAPRANRIQLSTVAYPLHHPGWPSLECYTE